MVEAFHLPLSVGGIRRGRRHSDAEKPTRVDERVGRELQAPVGTHRGRDAAEGPAGLVETDPLAERRQHCGGRGVFGDGPTHHRTAVAVDEGRDPRFARLAGPGEQHRDVQLLVVGLPQLVAALRFPAQVHLVTAAAVAALAQRRQVAGLEMSVQGGLKGSQSGRVAHRGAPLTPRRRRVALPAHESVDIFLSRLPRPARTRRQTLLQPPPHRAAATPRARRRPLPPAATWRRRRRGRRPDVRGHREQPRCPVAEPAPPVQLDGSSGSPGSNSYVGKIFEPGKDSYLEAQRKQPERGAATGGGRR